MHLLVDKENGDNFITCVGSSLAWRRLYCVLQPRTFSTRAAERPGTDGIDRTSDAETAICVNGNLTVLEFTRAEDSHESPL